MGSLDWYVTMFDIRFRRLTWMYSPEHAGGKGHDRAERVAGKATITIDSLLGKSEVSLVS